ncbi:unnamed protein product [Allacma fusca]|uniref:Uncharacterized protein n=1 Tax=Allacma fusca TaxID=39272 RepID=A0A8J2L4E3_9HEXA|nr:unnamed protein product [Allacma fusca]
MMRREGKHGMTLACGTHSTNPLETAGFILYPLSPQQLVGVVLLEKLTKPFIPFFSLHPPPSRPIDNTYGQCPRTGSIFDGAIRSTESLRSGICAVENK